MAEVTPDLLVYNSITNNLSETKLDTRAPFSLIDFLTNIGNLEKNAEEINLYQIYLRNWQEASGSNTQTIETDIKTQFVAFLSEIKLLHSTTEEKRYLENIDFSDDEQLTVAIPFFARKVKELSQYFSKKRSEVTRDLNRIKSKGSNEGLIDAIKGEILNTYNGDDLIEGLTKPENIGQFVDNLSFEIENYYDTTNDYYDLDPEKTPDFYDTPTGERNTFFTSNTNYLSGSFYVDTEKALREIINLQGISLKEIPSLLVDYNTTDTSTLPETFFTNYNNDGKSFNYLQQAQLMKKFMGTDMYYLSTNSLNQVLSGKLFDATSPHKNLLNINHPTVISLSGTEIQTSREAGLFFRPTNFGILKAEACFEPVLDTRTLIKNNFYIFPDPNRYGNIEGLGGSSRLSPFKFNFTNKELKNNSSSFGKSLPKSNNDNQNFYSYSSLEQDNFSLDNLKPFYGLESGTLSGTIFKEVGDIYGNLFIALNKTPSVNKNLDNFESSVIPFFSEGTESITLSTSDKMSILDKRHSSKEIIIYNTVKDSYEDFTTAFDQILGRYKYNSKLYNQLLTDIKDIDVFKNTFYLKTKNYLVIDNIVFNTDGSFNSKSFVSRVKEFNPIIAVDQATNVVSNISNPFRVNQDIFTVKVDTSLNTNNLNNKVLNFSIFKYDLNNLTESNIIDDKTTERSYFVDNFNISLESNIVQIKDIRLSFNKKQEKFFLITDLVDLSGAHYYHILIYELRGNKLIIHANYIIEPTNYNNTANFYKVNTLSDNFLTKSLSSTPEQSLKNGTLTF